MISIIQTGMDKAGQDHAVQALLHYAVGRKCLGGVESLLWAWSGNQKPIRTAVRHSIVHKRGCGSRLRLGCSNEELMFCLHWRQVRQLGMRKKVRSNAEPAPASVQDKHAVHVAHMFRGDAFDKRRGRSLEQRVPPSSREPYLPAQKPFLV